MVPICIVAVPEPERGIKDTKKVYTKPVLNLKDVGGGDQGKMYQRSLSMSTASSPTTIVKDNVWRTVNHFDNPYAPTVYNWLHSEETTSRGK